MKDTIDPLLGQAPEKNLVEEIEEIVLAHPLVHGMHDLIVHDYGPGRLILSLHAEVPAHGDLLIIHDEIDNIEHELQDKLNCSATIHIDPIVTDNKEVNEIRSQIEEITRNLDRRLSISRFSHSRRSYPHKPDLRHSGSFRMQTHQRGDHKSPQRTHPQYG